MKNKCQDCGKRPAQGNHFLCFDCKRREDRADVEAYEVQDSRAFKFEMREVSSVVPALQRRRF